MRFDPQSNDVPTEAGPAPGAIASPRLRRAASALTRLLVGLGVLGLGGLVAFVAWVSIDDPTALTKPADLKSRLMTLLETRTVAVSPPAAAPAPPVEATVITLQPPAEPPDIDQQSPTVGESVRAWETGRSLMSVGRHREAIGYFERATALDPSFARAHYDLGLAGVMSGDLSQAQHATTALRELDPNLANMLASLLRSRSTPKPSQP